MKTLPIDYIEGSYPLKFRWQAMAVGMPSGDRLMPCNGELQPGVDVAVKQLIDEYRRLERECDELRERVEQTQPTRAV